MKIFQISQNLQFVHTHDLDDRGTVRAIRDALVNEQLAIQQYEAIVDGISDEQAKMVLSDIANEEKVHVGELQALLKRLDPDENESLKEGEQEANAVSKEALDSHRHKYSANRRREDNTGTPIRPVDEYVLRHKRLHTYYAGGILSSPDLVADYKKSMPVRGTVLLDMGFDWTMSWEAIKETD